MYIRSFLLIALMATSIGCASTAEQVPQRMGGVEFSRLKNIASFEALPKGTMVIRTKEEWKNLFSTNSQSYKQKIDFDKSMVICISWGISFSGCYDEVETIERIEMRADEIEIVLGPLPDLGPCEMVVYPTELVVIEKSKLPIRFSGPVPR
jgi:hypothetical protein